VLKDSDFISPFANPAFSAVILWSRGDKRLEIHRLNPTQVRFFQTAGACDSMGIKLLPKGSVDSLTKLALEIGAIAGVCFLVELMIFKLRHGPRRRRDSRVGNRR
jgi:hypothetical protein